MKYFIYGAFAVTGLFFTAAWAVGKLFGSGENFSTMYAVFLLIGMLGIVVFATTDFKAMGTWKKCSGCNKVHKSEDVHKEREVCGVCGSPK